MKKNVFIVLLILSSLTSLADARFFLGIDGGYSMDKVDVKTETDRVNGVVIPGSFTKNAYLGNGYLFNINLGTEHHFDKNHYVGFRWFLSGGYGRTNLINQSDKSIKYPSSIIEANLGLDLLLDVIKFGNDSLGFFGGIEGGVEDTLSDSSRGSNKQAVLVSGTLIISPHIGVSLLLADHHRIEFVTKIPTKSFAINKDFNSKINIYKPLQFMFGYKFVF